MMRSVEGDELIVTVAMPGSRIVYVDVSTTNGINDNNKTRNATPQFHTHILSSLFLVECLHAPLQCHRSIGLHSVCVKNQMRLSTTEQVVSFGGNSNRLCAAHSSFPLQLHAHLNHSPFAKSLPPLFPFSAFSFESKSVEIAENHRESPIDTFSSRAQISTRQWESSN